MIKKLFTSSMVLWAAGWCYLLLALFYVLTDVLRLNWLTFFFLRYREQCHFRVHVDGGVPAHAQFFACAFYRIQRVFRRRAAVRFYLCNYGLIWSVLYYLYKNRTFIKV